MSRTAALTSLLTASLLPLSAAGRTDVTSRAFCSYTQELRTFGDGPDQFNMTVAAHREQSSCDGGLQCRPLMRKVSFCREGRLYDVDIAVAWVCAAETTSVPGSRADSLRRRRNAATGPGQHQGVVNGLLRCSGRIDPHEQRNQDTDQEERRTRWPGRYWWWQRRRRLLKRVGELEKQLKLKKEACREMKKKLKLRIQKWRSRSLKLQEKISKLRQQKQRRSLLRENEVM